MRRMACARVRLEPNFAEEGVGLALSNVSEAVTSGWELYFEGTGSELTALVGRCGECVSFLRVRV